MLLEHRISFHGQFYSFTSYHGFQFDDFKVKKAGPLMTLPKEVINSVRLILLFWYFPMKFPYTHRYPNVSLGFVIEGLDSG
jgi:hypothetical protein